MATAGFSSDSGKLPERGAAVGISNPVFVHPAEADGSDPAWSHKAGGQNWPVSGWRMPRSSLGGWGGGEGEPEGTWTPTPMPPHDRTGNICHSACF